jgi:hypothetical protein
MIFEAWVYTVGFVRGLSCVADDCWNQLVGADVECDGYRSFGFDDIFWV